MTDLTGPAAATAASGPARIAFTSGEAPPAALAAALAQFGLVPAYEMEMRI